MSPALHDEPGTRTRLAWARTALVALVVTAIALRGLVLRQAPVPQLLVVGLPALGFAIVGLGRVRRIGPADSPGPSRRVVLGAAALVCTMAGVALWGLIP